jgi:hypothetical protein
VRPATPGAPAELKPMRTVAAFFEGGAPGAWPASELAATWSSNHGERGFEADELKESFGVVDGTHLPVVADPDKPAGVLKLEVKQAGFAWWLARVGRPEFEPLDLTPWLRNGRLELLVRGAAGGEWLRVGLIDGQAQPVLLQTPLGQYGAVSDQWQILRVPLRALAVEDRRFDWTKVKAAVLASANGKPLTVLVAALRIVNPN